MITSKEVYIGLRCYGLELGLGFGLGFRVRI